MQAPGTRAALFAATAVALMLGFLICRIIVSSKFGKVLIAIRDAEARTRFLGYRVEAYKLFVFTLSACMAGVAGALYVPQVGIINPSEFSPANSIEAVIWVAVGGRGTLTGAVLGAVLVNYGKTYFTSGTLVPYWVFGVVVACGGCRHRLATETSLDRNRCGGRACNPCCVSAYGVGRDREWGVPARWRRFCWSPWA